MENLVSSNSSHKTSLPTNAVSPNSSRSPVGYKFRHSAQETLIFVTIYTLLDLLVILGNSLIILAFKSNSKLRTMTNMFFMSLAVSDLLVGCISIPSWMYILLYDLNNPFPSATNLQFRKVYTFLDVFSALTSIAHLTAISVERNIAISTPLRHRVIPRCYYFIVLAATWVYGLVIAGIFVTDFKSDSWRKHRGLLSTTAGFILPLLVIICMYANIYNNVKMFNIRRRSYSVSSLHKKVHQERTTAKTVLIVTSLFVMSWLPFFSLSVLFIFCPRTCLPQGMSLLHLVDFAKLLHYGNSAINPVVYTFRSLEMRTTLLRIIAPCLVQTPVTSVRTVRTIPLVAPGSPFAPALGRQSLTQLNINGKLRDVYLWLPSVWQADEPGCRSLEQCRSFLLSRSRLAVCPWGRPVSVWHSSTWMESFTMFTCNCLQSDKLMTPETSYPSADHSSWRPRLAACP